MSLLGLWIWNYIKVWKIKLSKMVLPYKRYIWVLVYSNRAKVVSLGMSFHLDKARLTYLRGHRMSRHSMHGISVLCHNTLKGDWIYVWTVKTEARLLNLAVSQTISIQGSTLPSVCEQGYWLAWPLGRACLSESLLFAQAIYRTRRCFRPLR